MEKRGKLFDKYQESLDLLNQGYVSNLEQLAHCVLLLTSSLSFYFTYRTGIGLSLCKDLSLLMNGDVWLDESYDSGVRGFPGARFVIDLNVAPLELSSYNLDQYAGPCQNGQSGEGRSPGKHGKTLPEKLSILFVDDDMILRKLFGRSVKRICPDWDIEEACNGETALRMAETKTYDVIFLDHVSTAPFTTLPSAHPPPCSPGLFPYLFRSTWQVMKSNCWGQRLHVHFEPKVSNRLFAGCRRTMWKNLS